MFQELIIYTFILFIVFFFINIILLNIFKINEKFLFLITTSLIVLWIIFDDIYLFKNKINVILLFLSFKLIFIEFYSLLKRGFTITIIRSIKKKLFYLSDIEKYYSNKRGLHWMLKKRIDGIVFLGFIKLKKRRYELTHLGKFAYFIILITTKILNINKFG
mgnify:FL=1